MHVPPSPIPPFDARPSSSLYHHLMHAPPSLSPFEYRSERKPWQQQLKSKRGWPPLLSSNQVRYVYNCVCALLCTFMSSCSSVYSYICVQLGCACMHVCVRRVCTTVVDVYVYSSSSTASCVHNSSRRVCVCVVCVQQ